MTRQQLIEVECHTFLYRSTYVAEKLMKYFKNVLSIITTP